MVKKALSFYFLHEKNSNEGIAVAAASIKNARRYHYLLDDLDRFIDLRCKKEKVIVPEDIKEGVVDSWRGLFLGIYRYIYEDCPFCGYDYSPFKLDDETETQCFCPECKKEITIKDV